MANPSLSDRGLLRRHWWRHWWHRWETAQLTWMGALIHDPPPPDRFFTRRAADNRKRQYRRYGIDGVVRRVS